MVAVQWQSPEHVKIAAGLLGELDGYIERHPGVEQDYSGHNGGYVHGLRMALAYVAGQAQCTGADWLGQLRAHVDTFAIAAAPVAPAEVAPDPICQCGHLTASHSDIGCMVTSDPVANRLGLYYCTCQESHPENEAKIDGQTIWSVSRDAERTSPAAGPDDEPDDEPSDEPARDYDPGDEVDDEGGMTEVRPMLAESVYDDRA